MVKLLLPFTFQSMKMPSNRNHKNATIEFGDQTKKSVKFVIEVLDQKSDPMGGERSSMLGCVVGVWELN